MPTDCVSYQDSGYFSKLIVDYLDENPKLKSLYNHHPKIENFEKQITEKRANYNGENRQIVVAELEKQYQNIDVSKATKQNISLLKDQKTFTIATGHQLNLFAGPLYFLYKICTTINLCKTLKIKYPENNFVPIFWMATEDHDFEEVNYFNFNNKKIRWNAQVSGAVGRVSTTSLRAVFEVFEKVLGVSENANYLKNLFKKTYLQHSNLSEATRFLVNELFKNEGLVILDADVKSLKKQMIPYFKSELLQQKSFQKVSETNSFLSEYEIQVNPREINLFYLTDASRERIIFEDSKYKINNTKITFSESEILAELNENPERFSPNVILRPLYQEVILANLAYVGGGGELAYWLQLKSMFTAFEITFPMLFLRNSALLITEKQVQKQDKLNLSNADLFLKQNELVTKKTKELSDLKIDFLEQKLALKLQFEKLHVLASKTNKSFLGALKAQEKKQIDGLDNLEKRLLKAEKQNLSEKLERIVALQNELFPNHSLQERIANFSEFYEAFGDKVIEKILFQLKPFSNNFSIITN